MASKLIQFKCLGKKTSTKEKKIKIKLDLPQIIPNRIAIKVKPSVEKIIRSGHPWVFDKAITKQNKEAKAGDLAIIYSQKNNKLLGIGLWDPYSPIRIKMLHIGGAIQIDHSFFEKKIEIAKALRAPLLATDTNSYRLIYGENDGLPGLIADVYDHALVIKLYSACWLPYLSILIPILLKISRCTSALLRLNRQLQNNKDWPNRLHNALVLYGDLGNPNIIFKEYGLRFQANLLKGHKTGYFLDHRHNRKQIGLYAKGKRVLDVFAYAGGFSIHALAGGAKSVLSIDISKQALELAKENARLNFEDPPHEVWAIDAFEGLEQLRKKKRQFDLLIIDPPAFAKKASEVPVAIKSYKRLVSLAIPLVTKGGILLSCSCSSRVSKEHFFALNEEQLNRANRKWTLIKKTLHDIDHPIRFEEGAYLKSGYYRLEE